MTVPGTAGAPAHRLHEARGHGSIRVMAIRDYESDTLTVHWDADRCAHSGHCAATLRSVFDPARRPWIDVTGAADDEISAAIDGCPSGALSYTRTESDPDR